MNRGNRKEPVFLDDECCVQFLSLLSDLPERYGVHVHAYALMRNHYHLMVQTPNANLSHAMRYLQSRYARWLNRRNSWDGSVFRGRFKNRVAYDDAYWMHLLAYIHLNPVRARLAKNIDDAAWTSHSAYTGAVRVPDWLTVKQLLGYFCGVDEYERYARDVHRGRESGPAGFEADSLFVRPGRDELDRLAKQPDPPDQIQFTLEKALTAVSVVTGSTERILRRGIRGRGGHPARWLAMWWLPRATRQNRAQVARFLRVHPSAVTHSVNRLHERSARDPRVARWMENLEDLLQPDWAPGSK